MDFRSLSIEGWQQFKDLEITFHPRMTVLTGANGSGKTTLLRFLARHFGWGFHSLRTPRQTRGRGFRYFVSLLTGRDSGQSSPTQVGWIEYGNGRKSVLSVPPGDNQAQYQMSIADPQAVPGFFLPSHRPEFRYERVEQIQLRARPWKTDAFQSVHEAIQRGTLGGHGRGTSYQMKEILIGMTLFGYGSEVVEADEEARELYEGLIVALRSVLPPELGFRRLVVRDRAEVVLETKSGDFMLDAVSGGVGALIELTWQVYMFAAAESDGFTVVIDEPENHLHPSLQRRVLPSLLEAFPSAQFVVATHSPLVVGAVEDSHVYALRLSPERTVSAEWLRLGDRSGSAQEVLREVLGMEATMPIWAEDRLVPILREFERTDLTPDQARALLLQMREGGLARWVPQALSRMADGGSQ